MYSSDALPWDGLQISFQRYGRSAWSANQVIRSWAGAPWKSIGENRVAVACFPSEGVWFGLTATGSATRVRLESRSTLWARNMRVPPDWQLGWIRRGNQKRPIALRPGCQSASFTISVSGPNPTHVFVDAGCLEGACWRRRFLYIGAM